MAQEDEKKVSDQEEKEETTLGSPSTRKKKENTFEEETEEYQQIELPPVTFENYVLGLRNTALIHLGFRDPETGEIIRNLPFARHTIDTIGMIQEKTRGNLTAPESNMLENVLYELRMSYLRADKQAKEEPEKEAQAESSEPQKEEQEAEEEEESPRTQEQKEHEGQDAE